MSLLLQNKTLVVAGLRSQSIWIRRCAIQNGARRTTNCPLPGLSVEFLLMLSAQLGFRYRVVWCDSYGDIERAVENGTADMSLSFMAASSVTPGRFRLLHPLNYFRVGFMMRTPRKRLTAAPLWRPLTPGVWTLSASVFAGVAAVASYDRRRFCPSDLVRSAFLLLAMAVAGRDPGTRDWLNGYGRNWTPVRLAVINALLTQFALFVLVLRSAYGASLVVYLQPRRPGPDFTDTASLAPLIDDGRRSFLARPNVGLYFTLISGSQTETAAAMRIALSRPSAIRYYGADPFEQLFADPALVLPGTSITYAQLATAVCDLTFVPDQFIADIWETAVVRKDHVYGQILYDQSTQISSVFSLIAQRQYLNVAERKCQLKDDQQSGSISLSLLLWPLIFWTVICCFAGALVLFAEIIVDKRTQQLPMMTNGK